MYQGTIYISTKFQSWTISSGTWFHMTRETFRGGGHFDFSFRTFECERMCISQPGSLDISQPFPAD
jgi:hypothetical protein